MQQDYGIIVRADGTIPFDDEVDTVHRQAIIKHLKDAGHDVYLCPVANEHKIRDFNADLERS